MSLFYKILVGALLWEGVCAWGTQQRRKRLFAEAQARAAVLGRPLIVVGDPRSGFIPKLFPAYGCGDVCIDLHGCPKCTVQHEVDITQSIPFDDDSAVVFVSCVLEYVDDVQAAWRELRRVAGDRANLFIVTVPTWSLASRVFPGARWRLAKSGEGYVASSVSGLLSGDGRLLGYPQR